MEILQFGDRDKPIILFCQGSMTHWSWYQKAIDKLAEKFHVVVPVLKGHSGDKSKNESFTSVEETAHDIESFLIAHNHLEIWGAYGLSIGGSIIIYILANNKIKIDRAIIDAGITPYSYTYFITRLILLRDFVAMKLLKNSSFLLRYFLKLDKNDDFYIKTKAFLKTISNGTIRNIFHSANNYSMPNSIVKLDTKIEYWYGEKEKKDRKDNMAYVLSIFPDTKFCQIDEMEHGEFVLFKPEKFGEKAILFFER